MSLAIYIYYVDVLVRTTEVTGFNKPTTYIKVIGSCRITEVNKWIETWMSKCSSNYCQKKTLAKCSHFWLIILLVEMVTVSSLISRPADQSLEGINIGVRCACYAYMWVSMSFKPFTRKKINNLKHFVKKDSNLIMILAYFLDKRYKI